MAKNSNYEDRDICIRDFFGLHSQGNLSRSSNVALQQAPKAMLWRNAKSSVPYIYPLDSLLATRL